MPFVTYRTVNETTSPARDHPTYKLLRRSVGDFTSNLWVQLTIGHALLYGNSYSRVHRSGTPYRPSRIEWLHSDDVTPKYERGVRYYIIASGRNTSRKYEAVAASEVFHLPGLMLDELGGLSPVHYARNTLGRLLSTDQFADDFFNNAAMPSGFFQHPQTMSKEAQERFLQMMESRHQGKGKRHRLGILEEDMKWNPAGVSPKDAMLVDMMKWGVPEVARIFNIPRHKLNDENNRGYNTTEQENKSYFNSTLGNWVSRMEYEAFDKLFTEDEKDSEEYHASFAVDQLFRADTSARYAAHAIAIQWGIKSRNEVRAEENLNPYEGGDEYLVPLNMATPESIDDEPPADIPDDEPPVDEPRFSLAMRDVIAEPFVRMAKRLGNAAGKAAKKPEKFLSFIDELETHRDAIVDSISKSCRVVGSDPAVVTTRLIDAAREIMLEACECPAEVLESRVASAAVRLAQQSNQIADSLIEKE